jgi:hypothetical protein
LIGIDIEVSWHPRVTQNFWNIFSYGNYLV